MILRNWYSFWLMSSISDTIIGRKLSIFSFFLYLQLHIWRTVLFWFKFPRGLFREVSRTWRQHRFKWLHALIARFIGRTWGPSGADRTQVGSMLAPWTLLSEWLPTGHEPLPKGRVLLQACCPLSLPSSRRFAHLHSTHTVKDSKCMVNACWVYFTECV